MRIGMQAPRGSADASGTSPAAAVAAAIAALDGTLVVARALLETGRRIDLDGLEREAVALCAAVMALDVREARSLRPAIEALRHQIDCLAATMRAA
jgi:hypothetical protein